MKKVIIVILSLVSLILLMIQIRSSHLDTSEEFISFRSEKGNPMHVIDAYRLAESSACTRFGSLKEDFYFNQNSGGMISIKMNTDRKGCTLRCDVSIDTMSVSPAWMCTGALESIGK